MIRTECLQQFRHCLTRRGLVGAQVRMRALQESTAELQGRLDTALAEKAAMHRQWLELRRQLAECTAQNSRLEADTLPCKRVRPWELACVSVASLSSLREPPHGVIHALTCANLPDYPPWGCETSACRTTFAALILFGHLLSALALQ